MKTIYKYQIEGSGHIAMPAKAKILTVQTQRGIPHIWAEVETDNKLEVRRFFICGTGHEIHPADTLNYIGTFQIDNGDLVFHLYEKILIG